MPKQIIVEGQTATNPTTGEKIVYQGGKWYPVGLAPSTMKPGAETVARLALGLPTAVEAQKNMFSAEGWNPNDLSQMGQNPYDTRGGFMAEMLDNPDKTGGIGNRLAKKVGGPKYNDYVQASKSFESAFMPILSGAAVTESEAQRLIRASLPAPGDTPQILAKKAKNRAMMVNGAAALMGSPPPFPRIPAMQFGPGATSQSPYAPKPTSTIPQRDVASTGGAWGSMTVKGGN